MLQKRLRAHQHLVDGLKDLFVDLFVRLQTEKVPDHAKEIWIRDDTNLNRGVVVKFLKTFRRPSFHGMLVDKDLLGFYDLIQFVLVFCLLLFPMFNGLRVQVLEIFVVKSPQI